MKGEDVTGPQHMFGTVPILGEIIMSGFAPRAYALEQSAVEVIYANFKNLHWVVIFRLENLILLGVLYLILDCRKKKILKE